MSTELRNVGSSIGTPPPGDPTQSLGFNLNFVSGRGLLSTKERRLGALELKILELEIPDIAFPFDVSGGADRFKNRRCLLRHAVLSLDGESLGKYLSDKTTPLLGQGFVELKSAMREGFIELAGRFALGQTQADFTLRAAPILRSPEELAMVFYDARVYGFLPIPASLLPIYLARALNEPFIKAERAGLWVIRPFEHFLRILLPQHGWKIPDNRAAALVAAEVARGKLTVVAGPDSELNQKQLAEREPPNLAVLAAEGMTTFGNAEAALLRGAINEAYELFRAAIDDERGGFWARERLLQIGAADPELGMETRQLAEEVLSKNPNDIQALLALANSALRERSFGEAANRFSLLAEIAHTSKDRFDIVTAELAAAAAAAPIDPAGALAAYERAAARARDSIAAHQALFELRSQHGDWQGAAVAGERLVRLQNDPLRRAAIHRELGHLYRIQLRDLKNARVHFERALRLTPEDPSALEGLAETFAARGEPARAASYLARLAEQAEESADNQRIVALNLRLGEIWERWLGDKEAAAGRYYRVLDADAKNRTARLRLASLAEARGELSRARALYEDILTTEETSSDPTAIPDLVAAYIRLAKVTLSAQGTSADAIVCLERAVELDPKNRTAREELAKLLRANNEWGRLIHLLEETASEQPNSEEARLAFFEAARLEFEERHNGRAAEKYLEQLLDRWPSDLDALRILSTIHEKTPGSAVRLARLRAAAQATLEPEQKAEFFFQIAAAGPIAHRAVTLGAVLEANPYHLKAAQSLVNLHESKNDAEELVRALNRLALAQTNAKERAAALVRKATLLWQKLQRRHEAEKALREASKSNPEDPQIWLLLADLLSSEGDISGAQKVIHRALKNPLQKDPVRAQLHIKGADLAQAGGQRELEAEQLQQALQIVPTDAPVQERLMRLLLSLGRSNELAELLEARAKSAPLDVRNRLFYDAAQLREQLGELNAAAALYAKISDSRADHAFDAALALERLAVSQGDFGAAVRALNLQRELAPAEQQGPILERLLQTRLRANDEAGAQSTAKQILEVAPQSNAARRYLGDQAVENHLFPDAINHYIAVLLESKETGESRVTRRALFEKTAALANEVAPEFLPRLKAAFENEFPEAHENALAQLQGDLWRREKNWDKLVALRRFQLERADRKKAHRIRREIAQTLHHELSRAAEAVPYYQEILAQEPEDLEVCNALVEIYESQGKKTDLASLLFAMSQFAASSKHATNFGLKGADVYAHALNDEASAVQVLRILCARGDVDPNNPELLNSLSKFNLYDDLAHLLERSISSHPDPDDGRFSRLVELLKGPLADPLRAVAWSQRMIDAFSDSDTPRQALVGLLRQVPEAGQLSDVLQAWAEAREGSRRTGVLVELADYLQATGSIEEAVAILESAAVADPQSAKVLQQLVDRYTSLGRWPEVLRTLERLAEITASTSAREQIYRRIVEVAEDYVDDPQSAIRGLKAITTRSAEEMAQLTQLYINTQDAQGLALLVLEIAMLPPPLLLKGARVLALAANFKLARRYLEAAMVQGAASEAWQAAGELWRQGGRLEDLGQWRLQVAATALPKEASTLRLLGYADIVDANSKALALISPSELEGAVKAVDLQQADSAFALFLLAQSCKRHDWQEAASRALLNLLDDADPRLVRVLRAKVQRALDANNGDEAVIFAERLVSLGDKEADQWLDQALSKAGRFEELLSLLYQRAHSGGPEAGPLWIRIANLHSQKQAWVEASVALEHVQEPAQNKRWGELAYAVGVAAQDPHLKAAGATKVADYCTDALERAEWQRLLARIYWRELGEIDRAKEWLREAQGNAPVMPSKVALDAQKLWDAGTKVEALHVLEEALVSISGESAVSLWLLQASYENALGHRANAIATLKRVQVLMPQDAAVWVRFAALAEELADGELACAAYEKAYVLDSQWEPQLIRLLSQNERWDDLVVMLEKRADDLTGKEAAARYEQAADVVLANLQQKERALLLLERSVKAAPTQVNLQKTFVLSLELGKLSLTAALGAPLLKRLPENAPERKQILRTFVDALDKVGSPHDSLTAREELIARDEANANDRVILAHQIMDEDPRRGARLLSEALQNKDGSLRTVTPSRVHLDLALLHQRLDEKEQARTHVLEAVNLGENGVEAHALAKDVLSGGKRLQSLARFLDLNGDRELEPRVRADYRMELADAAFSSHDAETALQWLEQAEQFVSNAQINARKEKVFLALGRRRDLADLWLLDATSDAPLWQGEERAERLQKTAAFFAENHDNEHEMKALELLKIERPDDFSILERLASIAGDLGDTDKYVGQMQNLIAKSTDPNARAAVVTRAAQTLYRCFQEVAQAQELLATHFRIDPMLAYADAIDELAHVDGFTLDRIALFCSGAETTSDRSLQVDLLKRAAHLLKAADINKSEELFRRVLALEPTDEEANDIISEFLRTEQKWPELIDLLRKRGELTGQAVFILQAADIAHDEIEDEALEESLLSQASSLAPTDKDVASRLMRLHLAMENLTAAKQLLLHKTLSQESEESLAAALEQKLRLSGEDADEVLQWLLQRYPESPQALDYRVRTARQSGDKTTLLQELRARLQNPGEVSAAQISAWHLEAGLLSFFARELDASRVHLAAALDVVELPAEVLAQALELATYLNDFDFCERVAFLAVDLREDIAAKTELHEGDKRITWLTLHGLASEVANDTDASTASFLAAFDGARDLPGLAFERLSAALRKQEEWTRLAQLFVKALPLVKEKQAQAKLNFELGCLYRDKLLDEAGAGDAFLQALALQPDYAEGQLAYGLILAARHQFSQALPFLQKQVDAEADNTPVEHLRYLLEGLLEKNDHKRGLAVAERLSARAPDLAFAQSARAQFLESNQAWSDAEQAWLSYLSLAGQNSADGEFSKVYLRLAKVAQQRSDLGAAIGYLEGAAAQDEGNKEIHAALHELYEKAEQWSDLVRVVLREAESSDDKELRVKNYRKAACLYRDQLEDPIQAARQFERVVELQPTAADAVEQLLGLYRKTENWPRYVFVGERLLTLRAGAVVAAEFYFELASAYEKINGDVKRVKELLAESVKSAPQNAEYKDKYRHVALLAEDYATFSKLQEHYLRDAPDNDDKASEYMALADIYVRYLDNRTSALIALEAAAKLRKDDEVLGRRLADLYALDSATYGKAVEIYREILQSTPLDLDLLRIVARLSGQIGDTERAYGYYAALLALAPSDVEAQRFVEACRGARPVAPQRPLSDADRALGLLLPQQGGVLEEFFTPLARFAELSQAGDLARKGVSERDRLEPTDARAQWLKQVLEPMGVPQSNYYLWRGGAFACDIELGGTPAVLLGITLAAEQSDRQRAFLVARVAELYRSGHALCERLSGADLSAVMAALCLALVPNSAPPFASPDSPKWAALMAAPMTPQIRNAFAAKAQEYMQKAPSLDLNAWRRACAESATRTALLVSCDIEEAIAAMLRLRGFEDVDESQRITVLQEAPEELDLLRFSVSEAYFKLRTALGLALRRAK